VSLRDKVNPTEMTESIPYRI